MYEQHDHHAANPPRLNIDISEACKDAKILLDSNFGGFDHLPRAPFSVCNIGSSICVVHHPSFNAGAQLLICSESQVYASCDVRNVFNTTVCI